MSLKWLKEKIVSIPSLSLLLIMDQALEYYGRALKRFESRRQENRGDSKIVIRISIIIKIVSSNIVARSENRNRSVHLTCKRKKKRNKFYLVHVIVRLALRELAHQLPSDVFRIYTVNQYKSYRKNFSTVGQIPSIRNRCLVYTRTHKFSTYYIYIFSIHTEENRSSKQTVAFLKRARDGREGWNCGPHSGVKALRSPILPLPPLYVWGFAARKNCGQIEGLCAQRVWRDGCSRWPGREEAFRELSGSGVKQRLA